MCMFILSCFVLLLLFFLYWEPCPSAFFCCPGAAKPTQAAPGACMIYAGGLAAHRWPAVARCEAAAPYWLPARCAVPWRWRGMHLQMSAAWQAAAATVQGAVNLNCLWSQRTLLAALWVSWDSNQYTEERTDRPAHCSAWLPTDQGLSPCVFPRVCFPECVALPPAACAPMCFAAPACFVLQPQSCTLQLDSQACPRPLLVRPVAVQRHTPGPVLTTCPRVPLPAACHRHTALVMCAGRTAAADASKWGWCCCCCCRAACGRSSIDTQGVVSPGCGYCVTGRLPVDGVLPASMGQQSCC